MISKSGMMDAHRKAIFSKLSLYDDDPKEARVSDNIAIALGLKEQKTDIKYHRPELIVMTGSTSGGSTAHIFTKKDPIISLEYSDEGINYSGKL